MEITVRTNISLPVIERVTIHNFSLYPGVDKSGLDISFSDGVTVIAGINGVGKTTLLTLLLRLLLGPNDPEKAARDVGRVSQRRLVNLRKFDFFAKRVPELLDEESVATLYFTLNGQPIEVTRYMKDMALKSVIISGENYQPESEIGFIELLAKMAGLLSGYDFHMVVRYLQFFNEDRLPLLWEPGSQFEFFKILFFEESTASSLNETFAQIQRIDTDYRNRTHQLNKRKESLPLPVKSSATIEIETLDKMIKAAEERYQKADKAFQEKRSRYDELQKSARSLDVQADEAQVEIAQLERQFAQYDAMYILQALPTLNDKEKFLMQGFATGCGCFVCGNKSKKQIANISEKTRNGYCFVCDSHINSSDASNVTPISLLEIRSIENKLEVMRENALNIENQREGVDQELEAMTPLLRAVANDRTAALQSLDALNAQRPTEIQPQIFSVQAEIDREQEELSVLSEERRKLTAQFRSAVDLAQEQMDTLKESLRELLTGYAMAFLQEKVSVSFNRQTPFKPATGADRVNIPTFTINMTSSTHKIAHERLTSNSVSESQKEFLDLAFRMTLLDMVSDQGATMLVIETPEASLDSWFMRRAADLMRRFAPEKMHTNRKVFATSNVNGTQMIPALLGLLDENGNTRKLPPERKNHLVNLLTLTPPSATLEHRAAQALLADELGKFLHA